MNTGDSGFQHPFYLLHNCCIECGTQDLFSLLQRAGIVLSFGVMVCEISQNGTVDSKRYVVKQWRTHVLCGKFTG